MNHRLLCSLAVNNGTMLSLSFQLRTSLSTVDENSTAHWDAMNGHACTIVEVVCCSVLFGRSLSHRHLGESRVGDDHRVNKWSDAAHLSHLLRHACRHVCLLWIPDQVSWGFLLLSSLLCLQARCNLGFPMFQNCGKYKR